MAHRTDLIDTAHLAQPQHFRALYQALFDDDQQFVTQLVIPMLPTVMQRPDRYGKPSEEYGVEVEPLLGLLIGTGIPNVDSRETLLSAAGEVELAIDQAVLSTRLVRRELPEYLQPSLDRHLDRQSAVIRSSGGSIAKQPGTPLPSRPVAIFLASTGKLAASRRFARLQNNADNSRPIDVAAATVHASSQRRLWQLDEALETLDRVLHTNPRYTEALTCRGAVLADAGRWQEAHHLATEILRQQPNQHTARLVLRTSKTLGDKEATAVALAVLKGRS